MRPPDLEAALIAILSPLASVATRLPADRPALFIRASRTGGARRDIIRSDSAFLIECYALTSKAAYDLCAAAYGLLDAAQHSSVAGVWLGSASLQDPVPIDNPDVPTHNRYQIWASLRVALQEVSP